LKHRRVLGESIKINLLLESVLFDDRCGAEDTDPLLPCNGTVHLTQAADTELAQGEGVSKIAFEKYLGSRTERYTRAVIGATIHNIEGVTRNKIWERISVETIFEGGDRI